MDATLSDSAPGAPVRSCNHVTPAAGLTSDGNGREKLFFFRLATQRDCISQIVLEHKPTLCYRTVGMVKGGMTQAQVAKELGINVATIRRWLACDRSEEALENCTGRGQKSSLSRVAKIITITIYSGKSTVGGSSLPTVKTCIKYNAGILPHTLHSKNMLIKMNMLKKQSAISKWTCKRHHSTRALATKLTERQHPASKSTVHQYLKTSQKLKSLKLRMQRWLTVNQKRRRLDFVKAHKTGPFRTIGVSLSMSRRPLSSSKSPTEGTARPGPTAAQRCPLSGW